MIMLFIGSQVLTINKVNKISKFKKNLLKKLKVNFINLLYN